jgi:hypothetical protein
VNEIDNGELELEDFAGGYRQSSGLVLSTAPYGEDSFFLGYNDDGYIWRHNGNADLEGYLFVGGSVLSLDITPDQKYLLAATSQGQVIKFKFADKKGENLITNLDVVDEKRYLFFHGYSPMVW